MRSYEILREASEEIGVKALAAALRVSPALVYKWCQQSSQDDPDASGARNPLDRLADIVEATGSTDVVNWLCNQAGGFFVPNSVPPSGDVQTELLMTTQRLVQEFSRLLTAVTKSIEDDGQVDPGEADRIRQAWEKLKSSAEAFSVACEQGLYGTSREQ